MNMAGNFCSGNELNSIIQTLNLSLSLQGPFSEKMKSIRRYGMPVGQERICPSVLSLGSKCNCISLLVASSMKTSNLQGSARFSNHGARAAIDLDQRWAEKRECY